MDEKRQKIGRPPKLNLEQRKKIITLDDSLTYAQIGEIFGVSKKTVGRIVRGAYKK